MNKKIIKNVIILMTVFILASSSMLWLYRVDVTDDWNRPKAVKRIGLAYTEHDPIVIDSDLNFSDTALLEDWSGDGSSQDPYIIEGLAIDQNNTAGHCISISNTRVNFTIQNCNLTGASINPGSGIYLNNVTFGKLTRNIFSNNRNNIYLWSSKYVLIKNNTCHKSVYGIFLQQASTYNIIADNNCSDNSDRGIHLDGNSDHNTIANNTCKYNRYGVVLVGVRYNDIVNNNCSDNNKYHLSDGIHVNAAPENSFLNNTCNNNYRGIYLFAGSHWSVLRNNTCNLGSYGFWLQESNYLQISNNTCKGTSYEAIDLRLVSYSNVTDNICTENNRAIRVYYSSDNNVVTNNYCEYNRIEGIRIEQSTYNTVTNNSFDYSMYNIYLSYADYNNVTNNSCKNGTNYGVQLYNSNFNTIANNTGIYCSYGIYMYSSSNNDIIRNEFSECQGNGIYFISCSNNEISWNIISCNAYTMYCGYSSFDNQITWNALSTTSTEYGAYDYSSSGGSTNNFDYNYYSEYDGFDVDGDAFGDTPFIIKGPEYYPWNQDDHPLALHPNASLSWLQSPADQNYEIGVPFYYDLNASSFKGLANWWINDTTNFNIDHLGRITNTTFLPLGLYGIEVHVNDTIGLELIESFTVNVSEYAPTWVEEPVDHLIGILNSFEYNLDAIDPNGLDTWWLNDTVNFAINQSGVVTNATLLSLGEYGIRVYVNDTHGNVLTGEFKVVVWIYSNHTPIIIDGDDEFHSIATSERWIGDGTAQSPYIIDYWVINRNNQPGHCISISNTRVFFEIRDCIIKGASLDPGSGIYLYNVTNCLIVNTTSFSNFHGIRIYNSSHIHISRSSIRDNPYSGIWASDYCYNISLVNNYVQDGGAGLRIYYTFESQFSDNICNINGYGLYLSNCDFNLVSNNTCLYNTNRGLCLEWSENNTVSDNICDYNTAFGLVLYHSHYNDVTDNSFSYNGDQGIHHRQSDFNNVLRNICNNNTHGMYIHDNSEYNTITSNLCMGNAQQGVWFRSGSNNNTMTNTTCTFNNYGLYLHADVTDNKISGNVFSNNTASNGFDGAVGDLVDYNYWGDYAGIDANDDSIGDTPYNLTSDLNQDTHPLMLPPGRPLEWLTPPTDQIVNRGILFVYDLDIKMYSFVDLWWINDTINFRIDQNGIVTNARILELGVFTVQVFVNDTRGDTLSGIFSVTVIDDMPPTWLELPLNQVIEYGSDFYYDLNASDYSGLHIWWLNDTDHFDINANGVITNRILLLIGTFGLHVVVNDTIGNVLETTFDVIIVDTTEPFWITGLIDHLSEEGVPFTYTLEADDLSGLHIWSINDTDHFAINEFGVVTNITFITEGIYPCEVQVNDTLGNTLVGVFTLAVLPAMPPSWETDPTDQVVEFGDGFVYDLNATDNSGIIYWWLNDTVNFSIDENGVVSSVGILPVGTYVLQVQVNDIVPHILTAIFEVTVVDTTAPTWVESPQNLVIEYGDDFVCDLNATDLSEIEWRVDDTDRFSVDWSGRVRTQELLAPGVYGLRIYVSDIYENTLMASILIEIVDTTPPEWSITIVDQSIEYGEPFEYQLSAFDLSGIDQWSLNNTESFDINYLGLITSIGILEPGVYGLTVTASDLYGNEVSAEFSVHVTEVTMTTTTTTTTTSTTTTTTATTTTTTTTTTTLTVPPLNPMFTLIIGFSIGGIAVVIVTILALRRKAKA